MAIKAQARCAFYIVFMLFALDAHSLFAQSGEAEIAEKYVQWAQDAISEKQFDKARAALTRALDYANVSSDIPYLLATLQETNSPRLDTLQNVNLALDTDRWNFYNANDANILKARLLICLMKYNEALGVIGRIKESEEKELLRLQALLYSKQDHLFTVHAQRVLKLFPSSSILSLIFKYAELTNQNDEGDMLVSRALSLSRAYQNEDLIWEAAPFMYDIDQARRLLSSWIAGHGDSPLPHGALPILLDIGVIDEDAAINTLFTNAPFFVNKKDLEKVYTLLRTDAWRELFLNALSRYSGVIGEDINGDGIYESICEYKNGLVVRYTNDMRQLGTCHIEMRFMAGLPEGVVADDEISIDYDQYPSVKTASYAERDYFFRMDDFFYAPVRFEYLFGGTTVFPEYNDVDDRVNEKILVSHAYIIEHDSSEFAGAREQVKLQDGIIISALETLDGKIISQTEYDNGKAILQKVDIDLDGKMETVRYLLESDGSNEIEITHIKSDWDNDGTYE
jgi:antitoxin component YwqK of YwqJK toxin-antitoxin module